MDGGSVCSSSRSQASNLSLLLHNQTALSASETEHVDTLVFSGPSSSFLGSRSMMSFEDAQMKSGCCETFFRPFDHDDNRDDDFDEYFHQPEKKKRLTTDQVLFLEKSFEVENKLEPERKIQLAKDLGLQPRQVAIWFQNRRARWKTKQLEKDYELLHARFNSLKADYENLLKEKDKLNTEVLEMTDKLLKREIERNKIQLLGTEGPQGPALKDLVDTVSEGEGSKVSAITRKQEDISLAKSDIFDSDSPRYTDGVHSSLLEPCHSPHILEADTSDLSQDDEDNLSKDLFPIPTFVFPKFEDVDYSIPPDSSCNFGFSVEDHAFWSWSF